jgi:hypothetical protein
MFPQGKQRLSFVPSTKGSPEVQFVSEQKVRMSTYSQLKELYQTNFLFIRSLYKRKKVKYTLGCHRGTDNVHSQRRDTRETNTKAVAAESVKTTY